MDNKNNEFLKRLRATFRIESEDHVRAISSGLIELEKTSKTSAPERQAQVIETIFREAHSLKGAARSVSLNDVESICQPMESIFAALKRQEISLNPELYDLLHQATDSITQLVAETGTESAPAVRSRSRELVRQLNNMSGGTAQIDKQEEPKPAAAAVTSEVAESQPAGVIITAPNLSAGKPSIPVETVRIPTAKLDPLLHQAEEMISVKIATSQRAVELQEINNALASWKTESDTWKARQFTGPQWNELLEWNTVCLNALQSRVAAATMAAEQDRRAVRRLVDEQLETMKSVLMLPVARRHQAAGPASSAPSRPPSLPPARAP